MTISSKKASDENDSEVPAEEVIRLVGEQLSYSEFYWKYMKNNWPVVLTQISNDWECRRNWTMLNDRHGASANETEDNRLSYTAINFDYLKCKIGNCCVPVADCSMEYFNSHAKSEMNFHDFLDYWRLKIDHRNATERNSNAGEPTETIQKNLYLKDWHLKAQMPVYDFYRVPKHFASDWLNEHLVNNGRDDYRFVYMGPKDSWTPFHADVFGSYSWSTNITGCKKWILLPPGEELKLADRLGNLPLRIDEALLQEKEVRFFTLLQRENEAIFVPSAWYHQVWNLSDTISVNHNWFNACNVQHIWRNLSANMNKVIAEIEDCRQMDNFDEHCQTMLRATFGINYFDFLELLEFIAERRINCNTNKNNDVATITQLPSLFETFTMNDFHIHHDMQSINAVLQNMIKDSVVYDSRPLLYRRCMRLMALIKDFCK